MPFDGVQGDTVASVLLRARGHVERGWCQGVSDTGNSVCMLGAVMRATGTAVPLEVCICLSDAIGCENIAIWNDAPERTREQVLDAFDRAVALSLK